MANIPKLGAKIQAQANTKIADESGLLAAQQQGIQQTSKFVQGLIKSGTKIVEQKIYETESSKAQDAIIEFMSEAKDPNARAEYMKSNNGNIGGFHTAQAKKNLDRIQQFTGRFSNKRVRQELTKKLSFQTEKSVLADLDYENRVVSAETRAKEDKKNLFMGTTISNMKEPGNELEYKGVVAERLAELQQSVNKGTIDPSKAPAIKADIVNTGASYRAIALVEGGNSLEALRFSQNPANFATLQAQKRSIDYVKAKSLDGTKRAYEYLNNQKKMENLQAEMLETQLQKQVFAINSNKDINAIVRSREIIALREKYESSMTTGPQYKVFSGALEGNYRSVISNVMAQANSIPLGETNTAVFKGTRDALSAIAFNTELPESIQIKASTLLDTVIKKQEKHEALVVKEAYDPLAKSKRPGDDKRHADIVNKLTKEPKYKDLPVEGTVEMYKLLASGREREYIDWKSGSDPSLSAAPQDIKGKPFTVNASKALEIYKKFPDKFEKYIKSGIKTQRKDAWFDSNKIINDQEADKLYKEFKKSFDAYQDKVENFEKYESEILKKYSQK